LNRITPRQPALNKRFMLIPYWHGNSFDSMTEEVLLHADVGFMELSRKAASPT